MRLDKARVRTGLLIAVLMLSSAIVGAISVEATISSTPSSIYSQYSCEKAATFIIAVDNGVTPNYYAMAGSGSTTTPCGTLVYGGPTNAGGATGTSAASVINHAIALANHQSILLECGTYSVTAPLVDGGKADETFSGSGWPCTDLVFTAAVTTSSFVVANSNWTFQNFEIDCSATWSVENDSVNCLADTGLYGKVNGVYAYKGSHAGIFIAGSGGIVTNSYGILCGLEGIGIGGANNVTVTNNRVIQSAAVGTLGGIGLAGDQNVVVQGNIIQGLGGHSVGIALETSTTSNKRISLVGNTISGVGQDGIYFAAGSAIAVQGLSISGNTIFEAGHGQTSTTGFAAIRIQSGFGISVTGNTITSPEGMAIFTASTHVNSVTISGNNIFNASSDGLSAPITINSPNTIVSNNFINATSVSGILFSSVATQFTAVGNSIIRLTGTILGIQAAGTVGGTIADNTITKKSNGGTGGNGIQISSSATHISITGNTVNVGTNSIHMSAGSDFITIVGNNVNGTIANQATGTHIFIIANAGFNPVAPTTYTACASPCTYQNLDGYDEDFVIVAANGISAWTCNTIGGASIVANTFDCMLAPGGTMVITWTVTAPTFAKVPLVG